MCTKLTSLGKCGLRGTGGSMWRGGRSKDGPWNQPLRDRRHLSCVKTSETCTKHTASSICNHRHDSDKKAGAVLLTWWKETGETSKRTSVFKEGTRDFTTLCGWRLPDEKDEDYTRLLLSKSTHTHTTWDAHCLLCKDRGFLHRCSAREARDTGWKQRASPPTHHHDTKEHLEKKRDCYMCEKGEFAGDQSSKIWSKEPKNKAVLPARTSPEYSYLAQEISTVGSSSTPNTSPSQERKRPNSAALKTHTETCELHFTVSSCILCCNDNKAGPLTSYKPRHTDRLFDGSNLPWHFVVT